MQRIKCYTAEIANVNGAQGTVWHLDQSRNIGGDFQKNTRLNQVLGDEQTEGRHTTIEDMDCTEQQM